MNNFIQPARCLCKALMALVLFSSTAQSADDAGTPREQVIELGELVLTSQVWGQTGDELVVALPGSGAANTRYRELGPLIAEAGYFFVALNQRGIQGSTGNLENLTLHDFADDVVRVIDYYQAPKAHLIGWAMGNRIQRMVATDHPRRVASVTLLAAGGLVAPTAEPGALNRLLSEAGIAVAEKVSLARESLFSPATDDSLVKRYVEQLTYWPQARQAQRAANQAVARNEWWAGGTSPMLIVQGLDDRTAPPANGRQMKQTYGERITLVEIENTGHLMGLEKPQETARAILAFIARHPI